MDKNMKILVVDDIAETRQAIAGLLGELGFANVVEADNGDGAMPMLHEGGVDLLIADWSMPNMDGLDLLRKVREDDALKDTPVLMTSGEATRDQILAAAEAGVSSYIVKPFTTQVLEEKIATIFGQAAAAE